MPWHSLTQLRTDPDFDALYDQLPQGKRLALDHAIAQGALRMKGFITRHQPMLWDELEPEAATALDHAIRTQIGLGVFRVTVAGRYSRDHTAMTEAIDRAASHVDAREAHVVMGELAKDRDGLAQFDVNQPAAFHQLLAELTDVYGMPVMRLASIASGTALSVDVVLENVDVDVELDAQLVDIRKGAMRSMLSHARHRQIPFVHAAALWVLAMRGRGSLFGEEERTVQYTDHGD